MTIDYEQLRTLVKEAMFTGGGINEPSAPEGIPHRMPAADGNDKEQDMGDEDANKMYEVALAAREATEKLVEALDEPIYDGAYEHAFKASACLRRALNSLEEAGAHPMPSQRVVAPPRWQQKYAAGASAGDYAGGAAIGGNFAMMGAMEENVDAVEGAEKAGADNPAEVARAVTALEALSDKDRALVVQNANLTQNEAVSSGEKENTAVTSRTKRVSALAGASGGQQKPEDIKQQLSAILAGDGVTPIHLRTALSSLLTDLDVQNATQIATLIAKSLADKQKGRQ